jgi:hypothetical protein
MVFIDDTAYPNWLLPRPCPNPASPTNGDCDGRRCGCWKGASWTTCTGSWWCYSTPAGFWTWSHVLEACSKNLDFYDRKCAGGLLQPFLSRLAVSLAMLPYCGAGEYAAWCWTDENGSRIGSGDWSFHTRAPLGAGSTARRIGWCGFEASPATRSRASRSRAS